MATDDASCSDCGRGSNQRGQDEEGEELQSLLGALGDLDDAVLHAAGELQESVLAFSVFALKARDGISLAAYSIAHKGSEDGLQLLCDFDHR